MNTVGIICEYNPFHNGHSKQFRLVRQKLGEDTAIICMMSGNYVQRGAPAVFDKRYRTHAALTAGADLVLELPVTACLSSAEGFAREGVRFLSPVCDYLSFGCEEGTEDTLMAGAQALLSEAYRLSLHQYLDSGISFPAARQKALESLGLPPLASPNDTLGLEYCKAILSLGSTMKPLPLRRQGAYHCLSPEPENPSATSLRQLILCEGEWTNFIPPECIFSFSGAVPHFTEMGERAILGKLRTMTEAEYASLPYGSEGLWRKLWKNAQKYGTLAGILEATKSKRYTRSRLDRMVLCAFLGITDEIISTPAPYARVLGTNDKGRILLKKLRQLDLYPNPGEFPDESFGALEKRCGALYGLFSAGIPDSPQIEQDRRIVYSPTNSSKKEK